MTATTQHSRRALLTGAGLAALGITVLGGGLAGCAQLGALPTGFKLSAQQLNQWLSQLFPYTERIAGLLDLSLQSPELRLLPESNRLGTDLQLALGERITGQKLSGSLGLDSGLRFDPEAMAIRLQDVRVQRLDLEQLPTAQRKLVNQYAPRVAELLLDGAPVYRFPVERQDLMRRLGLAVNQLRVQPDGLHVDLLPRGRG